MELTKYKAALEKNPNNAAALRALGEQAAVAGNWKELVELLHREAALLPDGPEKVDLILRAGRVRQKRLDDVAGALEDFRKAWDLRPGFEPLRTAIREIFVAGKDWEALATSLEEEATEYAESDPYRAAVLDMVRAEVCRFLIGDAARAEKVYESALSRHPGLRTAFAPLMEMLVEQDRWAELADVLGRLAETSEDPADKRSIEFLRAHIVEARLGKPADAAAILDSGVLRGAGTAEEGIPLYAQAAHLSRAEMIESGAVQADVSADLWAIVDSTSRDREPSGAAWRSHMLYRLGELAENSGAAEKALAFYSEAHQLTPSDPRPLRSMARLQKSAGMSDSLSTTYDSLFQIAVGETVKALWKISKGLLLDLTMNDPTGALEEYRAAGEAAVSIHTTELEASALRRLGRWSELVAVLERQFQAVEDQKLKAALLTEQAEIYRHYLGNPARAAEALRQALAITPSALGMVRAIGASYRDAGDKNNWVRAVMGQERLVSEKGYLIHLGLFAGELWRHLGREDEAFKCYSNVVKHDPHSLEALLSLEQICYGQKGYKNLYGIQRRFMEGLSEDDSALRGALLLDNASLLLGPLSNPTAAKQTFEEAMKIGSASVAAVIELRRRAYADKRWDDYASLALREADLSLRPPALLWRVALAEWAHRGKKDDAAALFDEIKSRRQVDTPILSCLAVLQYHRGDWIEWLRSVGELIPRVGENARAFYFWQMGGIHRWRLESPDTASECYARMSELNPADILPHEFNKNMHMCNGAIDHLREAQKSIGDIESDDGARAARYFCMADLAEVSESPQNAVSDLRRVLEIEPDNVGALRRLERLYSALNNPMAQIEVIKKEISLRQDPNILVLLHLRIGALWESQSRPAEAIAAYNNVPAIDPNELDALEALRRLHWQEEHWQELVEVLDMFAKVTPDPEKKVQLLFERAKTSEQSLGDMGAAIVSLESALEVDPKNLDILKELERLYESTEAWQNELTALNRQLELLRDSKELHRVHFKMGSIYEEKMAAPSAAIDSYVKAHDIEPQHLRTLDALERLYDQAGEAGKLVNILEEKAVLLPEERIRLYMWIGELWAEKLGDPTKAINSYLRVTDLDPKHLEALDALHALYEQIEDWENAIKIIGTKAGAVSEPSEKVALLCASGRLYIDKFNDDDRAIAQYNKALELNPRHRPAIEAAREIAVHGEKWDQVVALYDREIEFTTDPATKSKLFAATGEVIEQKMGNAAKAAERYELALRANPNAQEAIRPLARIYFNAKQWDRAEPLYKKFVASFSESSDPAMVAEVYYQQGRVFEELNRDNDAVRSFMASKRFNPDYIPALRARADLYARRQEWESALGAEADLLAVLEKESDTPAMGSSLKRSGDYYVKLGKPEEAINSYNKSLEAAGENAETLEALATIYTDKGMHENVIGVLDRLIGVYQGQPAEAATKLRKGLVLEQFMNDPAGALQCFDETLALEPDNKVALFHRAKALVFSGLWDDAESTARRVLEVETAPETIADTHCIMGRIALKGRNDLDAARAAYQKALDTVPGHIAAMDAIGSILEEQNDYEGYVEVFQKFMKTLPPEAQDKELQIHLRLGQVFRDKLNAKDKAILEYNQAVRIDPENADAHGALAGLYIQDKNTYPKAVRENNLLLKTDPLRTESYRDLARIFEEQREVDKAFCAYAILDFFGALDKWDRTNYEARLPHLPMKSQKVIDDEMRDRCLIHPASRHAATNLLGSLGAALCKVFGSSRPVGEKAPTGHATRKLAEELAPNLQVEAFDIYLDTSIQPGVVWAAASPPVMIVNPKIFEGADDRGKRFLVGRGLEGIANGLFATWGLKEDEIRKRLMTAVKLFKSDAVVPGLNEKDAVGMAKQLKKEVPRKVRKGMDELAEKHRGEERSLPYEAWLHGLEHSANRGGLVLSANPGAALRALMVMEGRAVAGVEPTRDAMQASDQLQELLRFAVSDQYFTVRKRAGLSLY